VGERHAVVHRPERHLRVHLEDAFVEGGQLRDLNGRFGAEPPGELRVEGYSRI